MRRVLLAVLSAALAGLVTARAMLPSAWEQAAAASAWDGDSYNVLDLDMPDSRSTAGSALIAEMDRYFLSRTPTAKNACTGRLAGKNLILILAEDWKIGSIDPRSTPSLHRLWSEGARFLEYYAPDWYQDLDGREFALLTGLTPTSIRGRTALAWAGEQHTFLPFTLARRLGQTGYTCRAYTAGTDREAAYQALGFSAVTVTGGSDRDVIESTLPALADSGPFFAYYVWSGANGEAALVQLWRILEERGILEDTAVCMVAGHTDALRGHLFLWGQGLGQEEVGRPCSELDVTPTLLNLFAADYDARFLSGRDVFSQAGGREELTDAVPLVCLYGTAYSDWVTDAGSYNAKEDVFFRADGWFPEDQQARRYVQQVRRLAYDRFTYARRVMENNYFKVALSR